MGNETAWYRIAVPPNSREYVDLCLQSQFPEREEPRNLRAMGVLDELFADRGESGPSGTQRAAERLLAMPEYADHDVLYGWLIDLDPVDPDAALAILRPGLERCARKRFLLHRIGRLTLTLGLAAETLFYWAQAAGNAASAGEADEFDSYLYLEQVAHVLRTPIVARRFAKRANPGVGPGVELEPAETFTVNRLFGQQRTRAMKTVVRRIAH